MRNLWLILLLLICCVSIAALEPYDEPKPQKCYEDMACWDCHTMGNKICGPER